MNSVRITIAAALAALPSLATAQAKPETMEWCRAVARVHAIDISRSAKTPPQAHPGKNRAWEESIIAYMADAKARAPVLTRADLESLGYAYCIERRPSGR